MRNSKLITVFILFAFLMCIGCKETGSVQKATMSPFNLNAREHNSETDCDSDKCFEKQSRVNVNGDCVTVDYCVCPINQTHSVSGNLLMKNDHFSKVDPDFDYNGCMKLNDDGYVSIVGEYEVRIPAIMKNLIEPSYIIPRLFGNGDSVPFDYELSTFDFLLNGTQSTPTERQLDTLFNTDYTLCSNDSGSNDQDTIKLKVYLKLKFAPDKNILTNEYREYDLFFALIEEHAQDIPHYHLTNNGQTDNISSTLIDSLRTMDLAELKLLNNSNDHIADHIEIIPFSICVDKSESKETKTVSGGIKVDEPEKVDDTDSRRIE